MCFSTHTEAAGTKIQLEIHGGVDSDVNVMNNQTNTKEHQQIGEHEQVCMACNENIKEFVRRGEMNGKVKETFKTPFYCHKESTQLQNSKGMVTYTY